ncbi:hypothetical protein PSTG_19522, partial [Puccinia striiformis f. sp. tritici PST-78]
MDRRPASHAGRYAGLLSAQRSVGAAPLAALDRAAKRRPDAGLVDPAASQGEYWMRSWKAWNLATFAWPELNKAARTLRDLPWYLWPTWPLALIAIWRWRAWLYSPHIWIATVMLACPAALLFFLDSPSDFDYVLLALPCAVLAAFSLPTLRRGVVNTLDWFAVMCFSLTAVTVWLGW